MQNPYHKHIASEKDLMLYENFLENDSRSFPIKTEDLSCTIEPKSKQMVKKSEVLTKAPSCIENSMFFQGYLKNHIGKLVKVESLLGNCLESRMGVLFEVGANYIVIKLHRSPCSMMIEASAIKYITIIHDNDINKTFI